LDNYPYFNDKQRGEGV